MPSTLPLIQGSMMIHVDGVGASGYSETTVFESQLQLRYILKKNSKSQNGASYLAK